MSQNVRYSGILKKWNDERGFGFIAPDQGGREIFVHISAFPGKEIRPSMNESISFEIETDENGKSRAIRVKRDESIFSKTKSVFRALLIILLVLVVIFVTASLLKPFFYRIALENSLVNPAGIPHDCDGRTMCSQMSSCAEAKWFINNCPRTKMDGNHDGVPCEQQWCTN